MAMDATEEIAPLDADLLVLMASFGQSPVHARRNCLLPLRCPYGNLGISFCIQRSACNMTEIRSTNSSAIRVMMHASGR